MNTTLFSSDDKITFSNVSFEINKYLHHLKYFDRVEEVTSHLEEFKKKMEIASDATWKLFNLEEGYKDKKIQKNLEYIVDEILRRNKSVSDHIIEVFDYLWEENITFVLCLEKNDKNKNKKDKIRKDIQSNLKGVITTLSKEDNPIGIFIKSIETIRHCRLDCIDLLKVIVSKLKKLQTERVMFQELLLDAITDRNRRVYSHIRDAEESKYFFQIEPFNQSPNEELKGVKLIPLEARDSIIKILENLGRLYETLNDINIERNKMRRFIKHYPAFREELLRRRSWNVRKLLKKDELKNFFDTFKKHQRGFFKREKGPELKNSEDFINAVLTNEECSALRYEGEPKSTLATFELSKESKIKLRILQILNNIKDDKKVVTFLFEEIQRIDKLVKGDKDHIEKSDITYEYIFEKAGQLLIDDHNFIAEQEYERKSPNRQNILEYSKVKHEFNWRLNDLLESANFLWLTNHIKNVENELYKDILFYYNEQNEVTPLTEERSNYGRCQQLKRKFLPLSKKNNGTPQVMKLNYNTFEKFRVKHSKCLQEISYFLNATKGMIKRFNDRLNSRTPTEFKTYNLKNVTLQNIFKEGKYTFSSRYRHILIKLGEFLENDFERTLAKKDFEQFTNIISYTKFNLEEVRIGQYSLISEYLYSKSFTKVTDKIQIYGGAFGIFDFEEKKLIRIQDRRYSELKYRPSKHNKLNKWYDLPERTLSKEGFWLPNKHEETVDLIFLAQSFYENDPPFYKNLTEDSNYLNALEKSHNCLFSEDGEISAFVLLYRVMNGLCNSYYYSKLEGELTKFEDEKSNIDKILLNAIGNKNFTFKETHKTLLNSISRNNIFYNRTRSDLFTVIVALLNPTVYLVHLALNEYLEKGRQIGSNRILSSVPDYGNLLARFIVKILYRENNEFEVRESFLGLGWFLFFQEIFEVLIFKERSENQDYSFIHNHLTKNIQKSDEKGVSKLNLLHIISEIQIKICLCEKYIHSKLFRENIWEEHLTSNIEELKEKLENEFQRKQKDYLFDLLESSEIPKEGKQSLRDRFDIFIPFYKAHLKILLKKFFKGIIHKESKGKSFDTNYNYNRIKFQPPIITEDIQSLAYDKIEGAARLEKFFNKRDQRINNEKVKTDIPHLLPELHTQGLIYFDNYLNKELQGDSLLKISERYINLCRFIHKELGDQRAIKVRCNFPDIHCSDINDEKYFIDKQVGTLRDEIINPENSSIIDLELELREDFLLDIDNTIQSIAEETYIGERSLSIRKIEDDIASILLLLFESVQSLYTNSGENANFLNAFRKLYETENAKKIQPEQIAQKRYDLFKIAERHLDRLAKFNLPANFLWRANSHYSFSQLIIPLASTSVTPRERSTVGFLMLGFRNVIRDINGNYVHITHSTEKIFEELFFTIRQIYQPLIHPYMDVIFHKSLASDSVLKSATRAGVSRAMSRNLAHNIGSHVLAKIATLDTNRVDSKEYINKIIPFMQYLRNRTSFIADVSLGAPAVSVSTRFGEIVHNTEDQILPKLVLEHISGIPNNANKISIDFKEEDVQLVNLPNDQFGVQAFYVILENIIRNAYRHAETFQDLKITICLKKELPYNDFVLLTIQDNLGVFDKEREKESFLESFQKKIRKKIINPETRLIRTENWGLLEMKIAAAYLRRIDPVEIDTFQPDNQQPRLLDVTLDESNNLIYKLYLERPKEIELVVDPYFFDRLNLDKYKEEGIKIEKFESEKRKPYTHSEYHLKVYLTCDSIQHQINTRFYRIVFLTKEHLADLQEQIKDGHKFRNYLWSHRKEQMYSKEKIKIINLNKRNRKFLKEELDPKKITPCIDIATQEKVLDIPEKWILFDNHGDNFPELSKEKTDRYSKLRYYEHYFSGDATASLLEGLGKEDNFEKRNKSCQELIENTLTNIVVIDERVQENVTNSSEAIKQETGNNKSRFFSFEEFKAMRVFVPSSIELPLTQEKYPNEINFINRLDDWLKIEDVSFPFIIIHITVLEKLVGKSQKELEKVVKLIEKDVQSSKVIFTSGRGTPLEGMSVPFIPYSSVSRCLFESRSKFDLARIVFAASMSKNNFA